VLEVNELDTFYGELRIIKKVSFKVDVGELVLIFGPNGHGKSTLLKTICGLLTPAAGSIRFNGEEITGLPCHKVVEKGLVYIPEEGNLFPEMTVLEHLKLGAYNRSARPKLAKNLEYVFQLFPKLKRLKNRLASALSGGETRMMTIGRGLMSNPRFLAIDEPSFGLAQNLRIMVFKAINKIKKEGTGILLVEQNTTQVADFADRICLLEDGRITFEGKEDEVWRNEHVRRAFLGI